MDTAAYLNRFKAEESTDRTLAYLSCLQEQHMLHVPFENLDVIYKTPILLDVQRFYQKVVENGRGGFCYELNGLFCSLLGQLGFEAHLISATVQKEDGSWALKDSHAAILVHLDQPYVVDVGFGDSVRKPLPLSGEAADDISGVYRIHAVNGTTYDLQRLENAWKTKYRFTTEPKQLEQFAPMCEFNQTSPDSHFTKTNLTTIATKSGRITLSGNTLITTTGPSKQKKTISPAEISDVLEACFQLKLT
jgi:N-hydroxyarylamine O-acetyltransferase